MSDQSTQAAGTTQDTGSAQQPADTTTPASTGDTALTAGQTADTSQQATEGQTATGEKPVAESTKGDEGKTDDKPAGAPEKYEFKAPEGSALDDTVVAEFSAVAKELNLPQDAAQKVIDKLAPVMAKRNADAIAQAMETAATEWQTAARSDKEFGGEKLGENLAVAKKALEAFGTPELRALLGRFDPKDNPKGTGLGNHPELIRAFVKIGKAISEDNRVVPGGRQTTKAERNAANALYPNQTA